MVRRSREEFDEDFLDAVAAVPDERTPIYSDNPAQWQADLMFLPYTNAKNETRLHAILCNININKYAFARMLPFTATRGGREKDYDPLEPLDESGE